MYDEKNAEVARKAVSEDPILSSAGTPLATVGKA